MAAMEKANDPGYEGLKILARMIARVYLDELAQERLKERRKNQNKEEYDANQRSKRGCEITETGENPAGDKEEKR